VTSNQRQCTSTGINYTGSKTIIQQDQINLSTD
jgi:hypothetical protein